MKLLTALIGFFVPQAHAVLNEVGSSGAGVSGMWESICNTFPPAFCNLGLDGIAYAAGLVVDFVFAVIAGLAVLVIIFAGLKLIFSAGNEEAAGEAKKIILYALIGLLLALLAEVIKTFVVYAVGTIWGEF